MSTLRTKAGLALIAEAHGSEIVFHDHSGAEAFIRESVTAIEAEARVPYLAVVDAARALLTDQISPDRNCGACGGTGVAWDWPAHTDLRAALTRLDAEPLP
jgi:hypothetical protein